jgi:hypothetical protein
VSKHNNDIAVMVRQLPLFIHLFVRFLASLKQIYFAVMLLSQYTQYVSINIGNCQGLAGISRIILETQLLSSNV